MLPSQQHIKTDKDKFKQVLPQSNQEMPTRKFNVTAAHGLPKVECQQLRKPIEQDGGDDDDFPDLPDDA